MSPMMRDEQPYSECRHDRNFDFPRTSGRLSGDGGRTGEPAGELHSDKEKYSATTKKQILHFGLVDGDEQIMKSMTPEETQRHKGFEENIAMHHEDVRSHERDHERDIEENHDVDDDKFWEHQYKDDAWESQQEVVTDDEPFDDGDSQPIVKTIGEDGSERFWEVDGCIELVDEEALEDVFSETQGSLQKLSGSSAA